MSRSYKKTPIIKDSGGSGSGSSRGWNKNYANRIVRRSGIDDIPDGKWYRKMYCSWNIYDYITYESWSDCVNSQYNTNPYYCVGRYIHYINSIVDCGYDEWRDGRPDRKRWEKWYKRK